MEQGSGTVKTRNDIKVLRVSARESHAARFLRRTETVEGKRVRCPAGRLIGTGDRWNPRWTSIPSDLPTPVRTSIIG